MLVLVFGRAGFVGVACGVDVIDALWAGLTSGGVEISHQT